MGVTVTDDLDRYCKNRTDLKPKPAATLVKDPLPQDLACLAVEQNSQLNLVLKRKFTELEDITKRLKARLIDVTDEADFGDLGDEFDAELNTLPGDEDVDDGFDWAEAVTGRTAAEAVDLADIKTASGVIPTKNAAGTELNKTDDVMVDSGTSESACEEPNNAADVSTGESSSNVLALEPEKSA